PPHLNTPGNAPHHHTTTPVAELNRCHGEGGEEKEEKSAHRDVCLWLCVQLQSSDERFTTPSWSTGVCVCVCVCVCVSACVYVCLHVCVVVSMHLSLTHP